MISAKHQYNALRNAFGREHLMEKAKRNGIQWDEEHHDGVNWMKFSQALQYHLGQGKPFDMDHVDPNILNQMAQHYMNLRELHKQTMIPHVRAAMAKLKSEDVNQNRHDMEYLDLAYDHLDHAGGHEWANKVGTLHHLNRQIKDIQNKLGRRGHDEDSQG